MLYYELCLSFRITKISEIYLLRSKAKMRLFWLYSLIFEYHYFCLFFILSYLNAIETKVHDFWAGLNSFLCSFIVLSFQLITGLEKDAKNQLQNNDGTEMRKTKQ